MGGEDDERRALLGSHPTAPAQPYISDPPTYEQSKK